MVEECNMGARSHRQRCVGCRGNSHVRAKALDSNPRVASGLDVQKFADLFVTGRVVDDAKLPIWILLRPHRTNRPAKPHRLGIVYRHQHAYQWRIAQHRQALHHFCSAVRQRIVLDGPLRIVPIQIALQLMPPNDGRQFAADQYSRHPRNQPQEPCWRRTGVARMATQQFPCDRDWSQLAPQRFNKMEFN